MLDTLEKPRGFVPATPEIRAAFADTDLLTGQPTNFIARQVIFREIIDTSDPYYLDIDEPTPIEHNHNFTTIEDLVAAVATGAYARNRKDDEEDNRLGIKVTRASFIVLRLHQSTNWTFSGGLDTGGAALDAAVKLQLPNMFPYYGALKYVRPNGTIAPGSEAGCRVVFFAAMPRIGTTANPYRQKLNYYIRTASNTGMGVDPDIRYPGNGSS